MKIESGCGERIFTSRIARQSLTGIQAIQMDIEILRPTYRERSAPTKHKQREIDKNYRNLLQRRERWVATGK